MPSSSGPTRPKRAAIWRRFWRSRRWRRLPNSAERPARAGPTRAARPRSRTTPAGWRSSKATFARASSRRWSRSSPSTSKQRPASSWGWYALGYSLFAQQKIGESIKALAKSLELDIRNAEAHKILGRNLMIIGRFDAAQVEFEQAPPLQAGLRRASLQPRQAVFDPGQLGARAEGIRGGASDRSVVHRGAGRPGLRVGSAGRRCRRGREVSRRPSP